MAITFEDYNKLSDVMLNLGDKGVVKICVTLNYITLEKRKQNFHREVQSNSGFSMARNFQYYATIEKMGSDYSGVMIRTQDVLLLIRKLKEVEKWFVESKTFVIKNKKLITLPTKSIVLDGLAANKKIWFDPIVVQFDESSPVSPGIRLTLNESDIYIDMEANKFFSLLYTFETTPLFIAAQGLVNYLGRPEFGTNLYVMDAFTDKIQPSPKQSTISSAVTRKIKKNKSFFDLDE